MADVDILIPVLGRPELAAKVLASVDQTVTDPRVLFIADSDDHDEIAAIRGAGGDLLLALPGTNYATKINAGFAASDSDFFFCGADDLVFHPRWWEHARDLLLGAPTLHVIGTNDLCNRRVMRGEHSTHHLVRRSYIEEQGGVIDEPPGKVLHEGYAHEYCDDEFIGTAKARGCFAHCHESIVEHIHPMVGKAKDDRTYQIGRQHSHYSQRLFQQRAPLWLRS